MKNKKQEEMVRVNPNIGGVPDVVEVQAEDPNWKVADGMVDENGKPSYILGQLAVIGKGEKFGADQYDVAFYDTDGKERGRLHLISCDVLENLKGRLLPEGGKNPYANHPGFDAEGCPERHTITRQGPYGFTSSDCGFGCKLTGGHCMPYDCGFLPKVKKAGKKGKKK
jgi:hypothetical protein